jgi:hypothetical protein
VASVLVDTSVLLDYLAGDKRAQRALSAYTHRSISVVSWLELMAICPPQAAEATRSFLRTYERLSISEATADEALRLVQEHPGLEINRSLTWATAIINKLPFLTVNPMYITRADAHVLIPYRQKMTR